MRALIFPQTALRPSAMRCLALGFDSLILAAPPSLAGGGVKPQWVESGLVNTISLSPGAGGGQAKRIGAMLAEWEQWAAARRGSGEVAAIKAGIKSEPALGTASELKKEIKQFSSGQRGGETPPPEVSAAVYLHLAHIADQEEADLETYLDQAKLHDKLLHDTIGLGQEDDDPADYKASALDGLPPLEYSPEDDARMGKRLNAWSVFAGGLLPADGVLATPGRVALGWLLEKANARLKGDESLVSLYGLAGEVDPKSPLAREAAAIPLPDCAGLTPGQLAELGQTPALAAARGSLAELVEKLCSTTFGKDLAKEVTEDAARVGQELASGSGLAAGGHSLVVAVFPGLSRTDLLNLMQGRETGLPAPEGWPTLWPQGSTVVLALA